MNRGRHLEQVLAANLAVLRPTRHLMAISDYKSPHDLRGVLDRHAAEMDEGTL